MKLEGNIIGYNKKTLIIATISLIGAFIFFLIGASYERYKLQALGYICPSSMMAKKNELTYRGILEARKDRTLTVKTEEGEMLQFDCPLKTFFGETKKDTIEDLTIGQLLVIKGMKDENENFIPNHIRKSKKSPKSDSGETKGVETQTQN